MLYVDSIMVDIIFDGTFSFSSFDSIFNAANFSFRNIDKSRKLHSRIISFFGCSRVAVPDRIQIFVIRELNGLRTPEELTVNVDCGTDTGFDLIRVSNQIRRNSDGNQPALHRRIPGTRVQPVDPD